MSKQDRMEKLILDELGDGLILRKATPADGEALADFNARIHASDEKKEPNELVRVWTHDLMTRPHPTFKLDDFTLVEDAETGVIVSSLNMISQTWSYDGIDFKVGRPELVGTDPDYRGRGLIRSQFDVIHQWSEQRGELVQAITGIPNYYRIYGYEMGMELGGGRVGFKPQIPKLNQDNDEPYQLRPAEETDLPFLVDLYALANERYLVSCVRDEELWRYELNGRSPDNVNRQEIRIIHTEDMDAVGYLLHPPYRWGAMMPATGYEIKPGISWDVVTPTVIRYLCSAGEKYQTETGIEEDFEAFGFWVGSEHPVYEVIADRLPQVRDPYAWYLRVPNLPGFVRHLAPVLEARLAASPLVGHTGELKLTFYRSGLRLAFKSGKLVDVEAWKPTPHGHSGDAGFPELTFLQLLFGYRDMKELQFAFADCWTKSDQARTLLEIIFPKKLSHVWPVS